MTNFKLKIVAVVAALAGASVLGFFAARSRAKPEAPPPIASASASPHRDGLDRAAAPLTALFTAPEGKTPCESAHNAILASVEASAAAGKPPRFTKVALRDDFLARCEALPKEAQSCMVPRYAASHRGECDRVRPPPEVMKEMFEVAAGASPPAKGESSAVPAPPP